MNAFSKSLLIFALILIASLQAARCAQERTSETSEVAPVLPAAFVSAAEDFRSKPSGERLAEGWNVLSLIRKHPVDGIPAGVSNFWFGPLIPGLSKTNLAAFLGRPDLIYTNTITGMNTECHVYTCGWDSEGMCVEFRIHFNAAPTVWLVQNSIISTEESKQYRAEVLPRFRPHYDKIIAALQAGELVPDASGRLRVPSKYPIVTMKQEAYVSRQDGGLMIGFKLWSGRKNNMEGYLYSDARLADALIGHAPKVWIGPLRVSVEERIDDHWYFIAYRID